MKNFAPPAMNAASLKETGLWDRSASGTGWFRTQDSGASTWQKVATGKSEPDALVLPGIRRTP